MFTFFILQSKSFLIFTKDEVQLVSKQKSEVLVKDNGVIVIKSIRDINVANFTFRIS